MPSAENPKPRRVSKAVDRSRLVNSSWWLYPQKPVRVTTEIFKHISPDDYFMEPKMDGFRAVLVMDSGPKLYTRDHKPMVIPRNIAPQIQALGLPNGTVLDGEIWSYERRGSWRHNEEAFCALSFWDVVRHGFTDLSRTPLFSRRETLKQILAHAGESIGMIPVIDPTPETCEEMERDAQSHRVSTKSRSGYVHGVVLKRKNSIRRDHVMACKEHADWLKIVFSGMDSGSQL